MLPMRSRWTDVAVCLLASVAGCSDPTRPDPVEVTIDFCENHRPVWIAYQNEGATWTPLTLDANGTTSFQAAAKLILAMAYEYTNFSSTDFLFTTGAELHAVSNTTCPELSGAKTLHGSVAGTASPVHVQMGQSGSHIPAGTSTFDIGNVANGPLDLVALNSADGKGIIRRDVDLAHDATIPVLDFAAAESFDLTPFTLTVDGPGSDRAFYSLVLWTSETITSLSADPYAGPVTLHAIPGSVTDSRDVHVIFAQQLDLPARIVGRYVRAISDMTLTLPPAIAIPTQSVVSASPYVRPRVQLSFQSAFPDAIYASYQQIDQPHFLRNVQLIVTRKFAGFRFASWDATVPDVTAVPGFQAGWMLQNGLTTTWYVEADQGRVFAEPFRGSRADGTTFQSSYRFGTLIP